MDRRTAIATVLLTVGLVASIILQMYTREEAASVERRVQVVEKGVDLRELSRQEACQIVELAGLECAPRTAPQRPDESPDGQSRKPSQAGTGSAPSASPPPGTGAPQPPATSQPGTEAPPSPPSGGGQPPGPPSPPPVDNPPLTDPVCSIAPGLCDRLPPLP